LNWHQGERATVIGGLIIAGIFLGFYFFLVPQIWDFTTLRTLEGLPLATDFSNYWAASKLALAGKPALAYNINKLHGLQWQVLGSQHRHLSGFYYPPVFLMLILPLGFLSYLPSFAVWIAITLLLYLFVIYRISPHPAFLPIMVVFPGMYQNFMFGQNAFLTGFFLGAGLLILDSSPLLAGCLLGFLVYKPQFIVLVGFALLVGRYWQALISAIASSIILLVISVIVFGQNTWLAYLAVMSMPMKLMESGQAAWVIMPTWFAATLSAGFSVKAAFLVQGVSTLAAVSGVAWVWWRGTNLALRGAVLTLGLLLFTPYAFVYELALLALPLCWLWEGRLPGELILLLIAWLTPLALPLIWHAVDIFHGKLQIGPVVILALFGLALVRTKMADRTVGASREPVEEA
jgi:hypothetical protein